MIKVLVERERQPVLALGTKIEEMVPGPIELIVEYDHTARGRALEAWQDARLAEYDADKAAVVAGFRAYVSIIARSDRSGIVLPVEDEGEDPLLQARIYYSPDLRDDEIKIVSAGQRLVEEVRSRAEAQRWEAGRVRRG